MRRLIDRSKPLAYLVQFAFICQAKKGIQEWDYSYGYTHKPQLNPQLMFLIPNFSSLCLISKSKTHNCLYFKF